MPLGQCNNILVTKTHAFIDTKEMKHSTNNIHIFLCIDTTVLISLFHASRQIVYQTK